MNKPNAKRVSKRYLKGTMKRTAAPRGGGGRVTPKMMVDFINFEVALATYIRWLVNQDKKTDPLAAEGKAILRKIFGRAVSGMEKYLESVALEANLKQIGMAYRKARRGKDVRAVRLHAEFYSTLLPWLKKNQKLKTTLDDQQAVDLARRIARICQEEGLESRLNQAAGTKAVSSFKQGYKWIRKAAEAVGAGLTETERVLADASLAKSLGGELQDIEARIALTDPNTPEAADLEEERLSILDQIEDLAANTPDKSVVMATAASAQDAGGQEFATAMGKEMSLSEDQEDAMMVRDRGIIAAGAGSGKTRVLAAKVGYHVKELGVPPSAILATSFTNKSSAELIKRIEEKAGVKIGKGDKGGFGTTHSIALKFLYNQARPFLRSNGYIGKKETYKQIKLIRLAIEQVQMPGGGEDQAPEPVGFWEGKAVGKKSPGKTPADISQSPDVDPPDPDVAMEAERLDNFQDAIDDAKGYFRSIIRNRDRRPAGMVAWAERAMDLLERLENMDPESLSAADKKDLNYFFEKAQNSPYAKVKNYRVAKDKDEDEGGEKKKKKHQLDDYVYFKKPAGEWFNLNRTLSRGPEGKETPIPLGEFKNAISILKGKGISPSQAWAGEGGYGEGSDQAAVYAAYEWLKGSKGEPKFAGKGDMDDALIDAVTALVSSPKIRRQMQNRFKVVLVDEAQDLNRVQHNLFGLITGYLDPQTLEPAEDKGMTADTYTLIGDDKQAIYEFRGADPEEFIDKSDMTDGGDDFQTKLLETNYRSGAAIVDAAQRLIDHNEKQVPMVCKAHEDRTGTGQILSRPMEDIEEAAINVAEDIEETMKMGGGEDTKYADFGVALRSNAEAYEYGLEMLKRGIPFKSNARFFNDRNTKALIGWMTVVEQGLDSSSKEALKALGDATAAPYSKLKGDTLVKMLQDRVPKDVGWGRWLVEGGYLRIYGRMQDEIKSFTNNVERVADMDGTPSSLVERLLVIEGLDGESMMEALVNNVRNDDEVMSQLAAESENGVPSESQIQNMAMAPIQPLMGLAESQEDLNGAMRYVRQLQKVNEKITSADTEDEIDRDAVTIGTMHSWKGLECPQMFVPMVGGKFPRTRIGVPTSLGIEEEGAVAEQEDFAEEGPDLWSERRLAYVAITRAEQRCILLDIPHPKFGTHSQFITEACAPLDDSDEEGAMPKLGQEIREILAQWPEEF